jgi:hypothetical protein
VAYLWDLDYKTSGKVDDLYDKVFSFVRPPASFPEAAQITGIIGTFRAFEQTPSASFSSAEVSRTTASMRDIISRFQVTRQRCV